MTFERLAIDATAAVDFLRQTRTSAGVMQQAKALFLPLPVVGELHYGAYNAAESWRDIMIDQLDRFLVQCSVLTPDLETARIYGRLRVAVPFPPVISRRSQEHLVNDYWTAALCVQTDLPLLTRDRDFTSIPDLVVVAY